MNQWWEWPENRVSLSFHCGFPPAVGNDFAAKELGGPTQTPSEIDQTMHVTIGIQPIVNHVQSRGERGTGRREREFGGERERGSRQSFHLWQEGDRKRDTRRDRKLSFNISCIVLNIGNDIMFSQNSKHTVRSIVRDNREIQIFLPICVCDQIRVRSFKAFYKKLAI